MRRVAFLLSLILAACTASAWAEPPGVTTVAEFREWIRDSAPSDLTLQQALRLNAKERGCQPRDQADTDAELAIRSGHHPPEEYRPRR
jgi:hypothetical protein